MAKKRFFIIALFLFFGLLAPVFSTPFLPVAYAQEEAGEPDQPTKVPLASKPSECASTKVDGKSLIPENCLFLEEPIGGKPNYDLFTVSCLTTEKGVDCSYKLWGGGAISGTERGPLQAILTRTPERSEADGVFLLYNYLGLIYNYVSGLIVGLVVLLIIVGGIQMTVSGGDTGAFDKGKNSIIRAITGMIIWFLASLILYTINPTFFAF